MTQTELGSHDSEDRFLRKLANPSSLLVLFDKLPGVCTYIKDTKSRFITSNEGNCELIGVASRDQLRGRSDFDFFPPAIAAQYVAEDQRVISSGQPLYDQVWFVPGANGLPRLYISNKIPLLGRNHRCIGIAGAMRPYEQSTDTSTGYGRVIDALAFISKHYGGEIAIGDVARRVGLSVSQLQREFSRLFGVTPSRYIREVRVGAARHLLESSEMPLAEIAHACGFCDQSHFSRYFKSSTGLAPLRYRQRFRPQS